MEQTFPDNMLAALLFSASEDMDVQQATGLIESGRWPVDAGYRFQGKNLVEIAIGNQHISGKAQEAIDLVRALVAQGVAVDPQSWRHGHGASAGAFTKLFVRGMGQGANEEILTGACKALSMIAPIKPIRDQAAKITSMIGQVGGPHVQLQGLDLISWIILHDFPVVAGGCATQHGTDDDKTARWRIRKHVFADASIVRKGMAELPGMLLDHGIANLERKPDRTTGFHASSCKKIMRALEGVDRVDPAIVPIIGTRMHDMMIDMCSRPGKYSFETINSSKRLGELVPALSRAIELAARDTTFCPDISQVMMAMPERMRELLDSPLALDEGARDLVEKFISSSEYEKIRSAAVALHELLADRDPVEQERIGSWMVARLDEHAKDADRGRRPDEERDGTRDILLRVARAAMMRVRTDANTGEARSAPRL